MSLPFKPHLAEVKPTGQQILDDSSRGNLQVLSNPVPVRGYKEEISSTAAFEQFGIDVKNPAVFMCELVDAQKFQIGYEVKIGGKTFTVAGNPLLADAGDPCDYAEVPLEYQIDALPDPGR